MPLLPNGSKNMDPKLTGDWYEEIKKRVEASGNTANHITLQENHCGVSQSERKVEKDEVSVLADTLCRYLDWQSEVLARKARQKVERMKYGVAVHRSRHVRRDLG
jgi:hypothetical protein